MLFLLIVGCSSFGSSPSGERLERIKKSPNYKDGMFINEMKTVKLTQSQWSLFFKFFFGGSDRREPENPPAIIKLGANDFAESVEKGYRVTWLGHSTMLVEISGKIILIDPVFSKRTSPFQTMGPKRFHEVPIKIAELPKIDAVVISHDHYDHLDQLSIEELESKTDMFVMPLGVGAHLEVWGIDKKKIKEYDWWQKLEVGEVTLVCTPARHFSGRGVFDENHTLWASWVIKSKDYSIYYSGDSGPMKTYTDIGEKYGPFDLTMIQLGAYGKFWPYIHMTPEEAMVAHKQLKGKILLPVHWGTFDLGLHAWDEPMLRTIEAAKNSRVPYLMPRPGQQLTLNKSSEIKLPEVPRFALESPASKTGK